MDSGLIVICDSKKISKKDPDWLYAEEVDLMMPGRYSIKYTIPKTWRKRIAGEGKITINGSHIVIADPCYIFSENDYKKLVNPLWLENGDFDIDYIKQLRELKNIILIYEMGGDGLYEIRLKINGVK